VNAASLGLRVIGMVLLLLLLLLLSGSLRTVSVSRHGLPLQLGTAEVSTKYHMTLM